MTIEDESGVEWALDPFFDICCPLTDYWQNEKLTGYFNKYLKISNWNKNHSKIEAKEYPTNIQIMALPVYEGQIQTICSLIKTQEHPSIEAIKKAKTFTENDYKDGLAYMQDFFIKDVMEVNKISKV